MIVLIKIVPFLEEGGIAQHFGDNASAVHGRVGVHRADDDLQLALYMVGQLGRLAHHIQCADAFA